LILEALLLLSSLCAVLDSGEYATVTTVSCIATLAAHLVVEGPRWQLGPAYAVLCCLALARPRSKIVTALLGLLVAVSALLAVALPVFSIPRSGPFVVGTRTFEILDETQPAWFKGPFREMRGRPLQIQLWYPSAYATEAAAAAHHPQAPYLPALGLRGAVYSKEMHGPSWLLSHLGLVKTRSFQDAPPVQSQRSRSSSSSSSSPSQPPPDASRLPVVLYSHGHTGTRSLAQAALIDLASRGFVVAAVDHTFDSKLVAFDELQGMVLDEVPRTPNVTWDEKRAECAQELRARVGDMQATMRVLEKLDAEQESPFRGRLFLDAVTGLGHSFGAATVLMLAREDPRVKAAVTLDGWWWPMPDDLLSGSTSVGVPTTVIQAAAFIGQSTEPSYKDNHAQSRAIVDALHREGASALLATLPGTRHVDYIDVALIAPFLTRLIGATGERDGYLMQRIVADATHASAVEYALREHCGTTVRAPQPVVSMEAARRTMEPAQFV